MQLLAQKDDDDSGVNLDNSWEKEFQEGRLKSWEKIPFLIAYYYRVRGARSCIE